MDEVPFTELLDRARDVVMDAQESGQFAESHVGVMDQLDAATKENQTEFHQAIADGKYKGLNFAENLSISETKRFYLIAGIMRCPKSCLELLENPIQPTWLIMRTRIKFCNQCMEIAHALVDHLTVTAEDECDWCGMRNITYFTPVQITVAQMNWIADVCDACAIVLREGTEQNATRL